MAKPRVFIVIAFLLLIACKHESARENEAAYRYYSEWYSYESALGIRYRDDTDSPQNGPTIEEIDAWYIAVNECVGVWVDPRATTLLVIRTSDIPVEQVTGQYWTPGLLAFAPREQLPMERMTFKHEVLHHLLWHTASDLSHDSPLFQVCAR